MRVIKVLYVASLALVAAAAHLGVSWPGMFCLTLAGAAAFHLGREFYRLERQYLDNFALRQRICLTVCRAKRFVDDLGASESDSEAIAAEGVTEMFCDALSGKAAK